MVPVGETNDSGAPRCGDGKRDPNEVCDSGKSGTALGDCNPECSGYYEKKNIRSTKSRFTSTEGGSYAGNLDGPRGADQKCQDVARHAGLDVESARRRGWSRGDVDSFVGDGQQDWVLHKYTHYYNGKDELVWRTDDVALLGVRNGSRTNLYAPVHYETYPWSGFRTDWTVMPAEPGSVGTCLGWTSNSRDEFGSFAYDDLQEAPGEPCSSPMPLLCVEQ